MNGYSPCFLIPCYNHGPSLESIIKTLTFFSLPLIIVDDGSEEETRNDIAHIALKYGVFVLTLKENQGKGGALIAGIEKALSLGFTHAFQIDADGQHDLQCVQPFLKAAEEHPNALISGCPIYDNSIPKSRLYGRYITHFWVAIETLSLSLKDSMCGFRMYPLAQTWKVMQENHIGKRMDFDTEIMVRLYWDECDIEFIDVKVIYPENGISHFNAVKDNIKISKMHSRLFFGMLLQIPHLLSIKAKRKKKERIKQTRGNPTLHEPYAPEPRPNLVKDALHRAAAPSKHWSSQKEQGSKLGIDILLLAYKHLGKQAFSLILKPVIFYYCLRANAPKKASEDFLEKYRAYAALNAFPLPEKLSTYQHFLSFGETLLDKLAAWQGDIDDDKLTLQGSEYFHDTVKKKKGGVIIGSHLGNIELCRALGRKHTQVKINALVFTEHAKRFQRTMEKINPQACVNLISVSHLGVETGILLQEKIDQGEWIVIVGDRTSVTQESRVIMADFLGQPAPFPQGPFILAALLKAPVFLLFGLREKKGKHAHFNVYFEPFDDPIILPRHARQNALENTVARYAARLEHYVQKDPLQWYNFFHFWTLSSKDNDRN